VRLVPHPAGLLEDDQGLRLVGRLQAGDPAAFLALHSLYANRVRLYITHVLGDSADVDDLVQEVFVRVHQRSASYERRAVPFRAWLFALARNLAFNELHRRSRIELEAPDRIYARLRTPPVIPRHEEGLAPVQLLTLPQQQVLLLRYAFGLSFKEIAGATHQTPAAARQLHQRALRALRGWMEIA
jgi:RNA polymerase sigma-70 factor (ECF subfamily)